MERSHFHRVKAIEGYQSSFIYTTCQYILSGLSKVSLISLPNRTKKIQQFQFHIPFTNSLVKGWNRKIGSGKEEKNMARLTHFAYFPIVFSSLQCSQQIARPRHLVKWTSSQQGQIRRRLKKQPSVKSSLRS